MNQRFLLAMLLLFLISPHVQGRNRSLSRLSKQQPRPMLFLPQAAIRRTQPNSQAPPRNSNVTEPGGAPPRNQ